MGVRIAGSTRVRRATKSFMMVGVKVVLELESSRMTSLRITSILKECGVFGFE